LKLTVGLTDLFNVFLVQHTVQTYTPVTSFIDLQISSLKQKQQFIKQTTYTCTGRYKLDSSFLVPTITDDI